jgi:hypothetical protein
MFHAASANLDPPRFMTLSASLLSVLGAYMSEEHMSIVPPPRWQQPVSTLGPD